MTDSHTANFASTVDFAAVSSIALVWSSYTDHTVRDYNYNVTIVPAQFVLDHPGVSTVHVIGSSGSTAQKVLYVSQNRVTGNAANEQGDAAFYVLREIWAVM